MKKVPKKSSIISASSFALISLIMLLAACGDGESKLVGKWIPEGGGEAPEGFPDDLELFKDGTGICEKMSINWKVDNNRFIVTSSLAGFAMNYQVSDSTLTITDDKGKSVEYYNFTLIERRIAERDKKKYKTVKIGEQTWMEENLNYNAIGSKCYENDPVNCDKYGRLYDWNAAMNACPKGWRLPTNADWEILDKTVGDNKTAGKHLKAKSGWNENGNGEDTYGFAALPGGYGSLGDSFKDVGYYGYWWSASEPNANRAYYRDMFYSLERMYTSYSSKSILFSVRCVMD